MKKLFADIYYNHNWPVTIASILLAIIIQLSIYKDIHMALLTIPMSIICIPPIIYILNHSNRKW